MLGPQASDLPAEATCAEVSMAESHVSQQQPAVAQEQRMTSDGSNGSSSSGAWLAAPRGAAAARALGTFDEGRYAAYVAGAYTAAQASCSGALDSSVACGSWALHMSWGTSVLQSEA